MNKIKPDLDWQLEVWKNAVIMDCWRMKWYKPFRGWVSRMKEPCVGCERPTCASLDKTREERGFDGKRTYFLDLIEHNSYVHQKYLKV